jgi:hypothetical protein
VAESFSIPRSMYCDLALSALQEEIQSRTGSATATEGILRCIERFGADDSILYYEMMPQANRRTRHSEPTASWTVRAVR